MHVVKAVPGSSSLHGDFVIDSPVTGEAEILASLTDRDKGEIAYRFWFRFLSIAQNAVRHLLSALRYCTAGDRLRPTLGLITQQKKDTPFGLIPAFSNRHSIVWARLIDSTILNLRRHLLVPPLPFSGKARPSGTSFYLGKT